MKKTIKTSKKALSILLTMLMLMTSWIFVAPENFDAEAAEESTIGGMAVSNQSYTVGRTDKYGTPMFDGKLL